LAFRPLAMGRRKSLFFSRRNAARRTMSLEGPRRSAMMRHPVRSFATSAVISERPAPLRRMLQEPARLQGQNCATASRAVLSIDNLGDARHRGRLPHVHRRLAVPPDADPFRRMVRRRSNQQLSDRLQRSVGSRNGAGGHNPLYRREPPLNQSRTHWGAHDRAKRVQIPIGGARDRAGDASMRGS
jgi:hypothetical protein